LPKELSPGFRGMERNRNERVLFIVCRSRDVITTRNHICSYDSDSDAHANGRAGHLCLRVTHFIPVVEMAELASHEFCGFGGQLTTLDRLED